MRKGKYELQHEEREISASTRGWTGNGKVLLDEGGLYLLLMSNIKNNFNMLSFTQTLPQHFTLLHIFKLKFS